MFFNNFQSVNNDNNTTDKSTEHGNYQEGTSAKKEPFKYFVLDDIESLGLQQQQTNNQSEFSQVNQWKRSLDDIEAEQKNQEQLLSKLAAIEEKLNKILELITITDKLENETDTKPKRKNSWWAKYILKSNE